MNRSFPYALLVGFRDGLARALARRLEAAGFVVVRVAHGLAAQDEALRLGVSLVVTSNDLFSMEKNAIAETASLLGAPIVSASREEDLDRVLAHFSFRRLRAAS
ncbi:MAG TPA: hypothetical protein VIF62_37045 [Labilithrix sp.]|jgi:ABC-type sugar transport system substrate-binding protein